MTTFGPWTGTVCRDLSALCSQQVAYEDQSLPYFSFPHWLCWACSALSVESVSTPATLLLETPELESDSLALTYTGPSQLFCSWMASIYDWCPRVNVFSYLDPSCHRAAECERCEASIPQEPPEDRSDSWWRFPAALNHFRPTRGKGPLPNLRHHVALLRLQCQVLPCVILFLLICTIFCLLWPFDT